MKNKTMLIILLVLSAGLFCFAGNVHSQSYYYHYTCYAGNGTYYDSNVPCRNQYYYDRGPIVEFDSGTRYYYGSHDRHWNFGSGGGHGSERERMGP